MCIITFDKFKDIVSRYSDSAQCTLIASSQLAARSSKVRTHLSYSSFGQFTFGEGKGKCLHQFAFYLLLLLLRMKKNKAPTTAGLSTKEEDIIEDSYLKMLGNRRSL